MGLPVAAAGDFSAVDAGEAGPGAGALLALLDVEALVVIGDEEPFVMVDFGIGRGPSAAGGAVGADDEDFAHRGFVGGVEVGRGNEGDEAGGGDVLDDVVVEVRGDVLAGFGNGGAEEVLVGAMDVDGATDLFADAEAFGALGERRHDGCALRR